MTSMSNYLSLFLNVMPIYIYICCGGGGCFTCQIK